MIISLTVLLILFAAVIGSAAMASVLVHFLYRIRQIEVGSTEVGSRQLVDQLNLMRDELLTVQDEMSALSERLDFTEKLLMSGNDVDSSGGSD